MQLRKMLVMLTAVGAMSLMMTGCDGDTATAGLCTDDTDCTGNEICHPTAQVCVSTCESSNDCPANAKNCQPLEGTSVSVCECQTTQQCNLDRDTADQVCSTVDQVCVTACSADTDCPSGRTCDTATGQCLVGTSSDPCNGQCAANETCDTTGTTPVCVPPSTVGDSCQGTAQSTCSYGEYCRANTCTAAPVAEATCENFSSNRPEWSPSSSGPVIYEVSRIRYEAANPELCVQPGPDAGYTSSDAYIVRVRAYRTDADWPDTRAGLSGFFYVATNTTRTDVVASGSLIKNTGYNRNPTNKRDAEFQVALCRRSDGGNQLQVGFYFTGGNPVCQVIQRQ